MTSTAALSNQTRTTPPEFGSEVLSREDARHATPPAVNALIPPVYFGVDQSLRVVPARAGDHHLIHELLVSVSHQPSAAEFHAQLDDPYYEPCDRLLVKQREQVLAHVRMTHRSMHFGNMVLPVSVFSDLVVLPEYREQNCVESLLQAAERALVSSGSQLGFLRTRDPDFFVRHGWTICTRHSYSTAGARDILSRLHDRPVSPRDPLAPEAIPLNIRMWRHVELAALTRLYEEQTRAAHGPLVRSDAYWQWLISRRAYDRIYVAIEGPDKMELNDALSPIVGYAVMREGRIVELITAGHQPDAAQQLLARACGDAIEHDLHHVRLDAAPNDPLHQILADAGGQRCYHESDSGEVTVIKMVDPRKFLVASLDSLYQRAKAAELSLPCELGLLVDGQRYLLSVRPRTVKFIADKLGRSYIECGRNGLTKLLLGHLDVAEAVASGRLLASTRVASEAARTLFPQLPFWRPTFDDLPA